MIELLPWALKIPSRALEFLFWILAPRTSQGVRDIPDGYISKLPFQFMTDYNSEDHFTSRIGTGSLLNMEKMDCVQSVLENLEKFHNHYREERKLTMAKQR